MTPVEWWAPFLSAVAGGGAVAGVVAFLAKESLTRLLDRQAEQLKHRLGIDATTRELLLRSQIEFKERQGDVPRSVESRPRSRPDIYATCSLVSSMFLLTTASSAAIS